VEETTEYKLFWLVALLPCPFCGNNAHFLKREEERPDGVYKAGVICSNSRCFADISSWFPQSTTLEEAASRISARWNLRYAVQ